jgi:hypothetical protein
VQQQRGTKIETLADGRQITLDFEHLPNLDQQASLFTEDGARFSLESKAGPYSLNMPTKGRDALRFNAAGPLAMIEKESRKFIANRMCPKCFAGPMAESECGLLQIHHGEAALNAKRQTFQRDNSCRRCKFLGRDVKEYPLYDPVVADGVFGPERMTRTMCVDFICRGFDKIIPKLPEVATSLAGLYYHREQLYLSNLPLESLKSKLNAARTAVIRYHLSSSSPAPESASSFGGIVWRSIIHDSSTRRNGWADFREEWFNCVLGADCFYNGSPVESNVFFAAVVVPLVMRELSAQERDLFAEGSFSSIRNVWGRLIQASQRDLSDQKRKVLCAKYIFVRAFLEIAFGFISFTACNCAAYWFVRLATLVLPLTVNESFFRSSYIFLLTLILAGTLYPHSASYMFTPHTRQRTHMLPRLFLKFLGALLSLALGLFFVRDFTFSKSLLMLVQLPLCFCTSNDWPVVSACNFAFCNSNDWPLVSASSYVEFTRGFSEMIFGIWPRMIRASTRGAQRRNVSQTAADIMKNLFHAVLATVKTCLHFVAKTLALVAKILALMCSRPDVLASVVGTFFFFFPGACWFLSKITLEPGLVEPNSNPTWQQIEIISNWALIGFVVFIFIICMLNNPCVACCSPFLVMFFALMASSPMFWVYSSFTHSEGDTYHGEYFINVTLHNGTVHGSGFFHGERRTGLGHQLWNNGDNYVGEWLNNSMHGNGTYSWADGQQYPPLPLTTTPRLRIKHCSCAGTKAIGLTAREVETASKDGLTAEFTKASGAAASERA